MSTNPYDLQAIEVELPPPGEPLPMSWQVAIKDAETGQPLTDITELHLHLEPDLPIRATAHRVHKDDPAFTAWSEYIVTKVSFR